MNIKVIEPVKIWMAGNNKIANRLWLYNYGGYDFATATDSYASYRLGVVVIEVIDEVEEERFESYAEGSVILPPELVQSWGTDDDPIWEYVMQELNLKEVV